jgi:benzoate-CoA ligase
VHSSLIQTAELYAKPVLGIREDDVVFSAAKLFFAYGLGNALTFPDGGRRDDDPDGGARNAACGHRATCAPLSRRSSTACRRFSPRCSLTRKLPTRGALKLRSVASAGEALPADIGRRWTERFGVEILDGLGSTETAAHLPVESARRSSLRNERRPGAGLRTAHRRRRRPARCGG